MKKLTLATSLALALSTGFLSAAATAAQKIGVVDVQAVFQQLPQAASIEAVIRNEFKDRIEEVNRIEQDLKYFMDKQKREAATMSKAENEELVKKALALREDYTNKAQPLDQEIRQRNAEERNKILAVIKQTIDAVAAEEKYDMIIQANAVAYIASEKDNISAKVVDKVSKAK
ncbi:OmpH family outer membrane protein [Algibacillus agarilyticus]|uniref:OmpH family outer membrane protein n=1 Tax=Algibacillus agarilyticus TaxID=2234133 RepID=UPI001E6543F2|nr:OmpH family outer membrane protein [Algibacillus agarilyticus]